tara:strand:- start:402 stop:836 length:435 start_codon:yes stop_codon:yes gene_type:complete
MLIKKGVKMNNRTLYWKDTKYEILREAGDAQLAYWTAKLEQGKKFPNTLVTIGEATSSKEGKAKFEQAQLDVQTPEYKELSKIAKEAITKFEKLEKEYFSLSSDLVHYGFRKRQLPEMYGEMLKHMTKDKSREMLTAKSKVVWG